MFEWLANKLKELTDNVIDFLIELGYVALQQLQLAHCWGDIVNTTTTTATVMKQNVPIVQMLVDLGALHNVLMCSISILTTIMFFKIVVKLIPAIY